MVWVVTEHDMCRNRGGPPTAKNPSDPNFWKQMQGLYKRLPQHLPCIWKQVVSILRTRAIANEWLNETRKLDSAFSRQHLRVYRHAIAHQLESNPRIY